MAAIRAIPLACLLGLALLGLVSCQAEPQGGESPLFPLELSWASQTSGSILRAPRYTEQIVFVLTSKYLVGYIYALDVTTGELLWSTSSSEGLYMSQWVVSEDQLIVAGSDNVRALSLENGKELWSKTGFVRQAQIAMGADTLFVSSYHKVTALNPTTGIEKWETSFPEGTGTLFYNETSDQLIMAAGGFSFIDPQTGRVIKTSDVDGGVSYCGSESFIEANKLYCSTIVYEASGGKRLAANYDVDRLEYWPPLLDAGVLYYRTEEGRIIAAREEDLTILWEYQPSSLGKDSQPRIISNVVILDAVAYAIADDATLRAFDAKTGQDIGWWQAPSVNNWEEPEGFSLVTYYPGLATDGVQLFATFGTTTLYTFHPKSPEEK